MDAKSKMPEYSYELAIARVHEILSSKTLNINLNDMAHKTPPKITHMGRGKKKKEKKKKKKSRDHAV